MPRRGLLVGVAGSVGGAAPLHVVTAAAVGRPSHGGAALRWLPIALVAQAQICDGEAVPGDIWEVDLAARKHRQVGTLPERAFSVFASPDGTRILLGSNSKEGTTLELRDGATGTPLWSRTNAAAGRQLTGRFYSGGRIAIAEIRGGEAFLTVLTADGVEQRTIALWQRLLSEGLYVNLIVPPGCPVDKCVLRASCSAAHSPDQLARALDTLGRVGAELGVTRVAMS